MPELLSAGLADRTERFKVVSGRSLFVVAAVLLLVAGGALRIRRLADRSLWYDEAVTANGSRGTLLQVLEVTRHCSAPIIHPYILYLAEKVGNGAAAARAPSVLASLLAILVMLALVRAKVNPIAALFAAALLSFSASQIRYAQEVREYSLSVLVAASLIFCLFRWEAEGPRSRHPILLYAVLFVAPLVQYGLVFFGLAILSTLVLCFLLSRESCSRIEHAVLAAASLAAGGMLSFFLTLRYQFKPGVTAWYLAPQYFDRRTMNLLHFLGTNSFQLLRFSMPGLMVKLLFIVAAVIFCIRQLFTRKVDLITLLLLTSFSITMGASVAGMYPYGGVRQCLFLTPVLALFAGVVFSDLLQRLRGPARPMLTAAVFALVIQSLYRGTLRDSPYKEFEDTKTILRELAKSIGPNDQVWVNHDAVDAFKFYQGVRDPRFIYGKFHENANEYTPELLRSFDQNSDRLWLVFSHLEQGSDRAEEQLIVNSLRPSWEVHSVVAPTNAELYVANRRPPAQAMAPIRNIMPSNRDSDTH
jgi:Dolichyl-phosphate-mannose-protein mannosyltransferase